MTYANPPELVLKIFLDQCYDEGLLGGVTVIFKRQLNRITIFGTAELRGMSHCANFYFCPTTL